MFYSINTNKKYTVFFYDDDEIIIEFTGEEYDIYMEFLTYECWSIDADGEYDKKCHLHVKRDTYDYCYIEIFTKDDVSNKIIVRKLVEV